MPGQPPAIEVRDLCKSFRMRAARTRKRGGVRVRAKGYRFQRVPVLDGISFDVGRGELFGIVGRNGSGKSTLLKILASIYDYDSGSIRMVGRLAPFVELGVGFHPELTAWDNVCTNSIMMGLTPQQARERFEKVLEFAELEEFRGLELKNYSSGMRMRLAFATLLEVDADIFLIDEILAVGDARFREKCASAFMRLREQGKTIVLVSHSAGDIRRYCDRALCLHEAGIERIGDPEEVVTHYLELQASQPQRQGGSKHQDGSTRQDGSKRSPGPAANTGREPSAELTDVWLEDSIGRVASRVPQDELPELHALIEVSRGMNDPAFACEIHDEEGSVVRTLDVQPLGGSDRRLAREDRLHVHAPLGEGLPPGSYVATCRVLRADRMGRRIPATDPGLLDFAVSRAGRTRPATPPAAGTSGPANRKAAARL